MTVYTELLRERLGRSPEGRPVGALVAELLVRRARLVSPSGGPGSLPRAAGAGPERLAELLDYDECLVRLCDQLGVRHDMLEPFAPPNARHEAERALTRRLPLLVVLEEAPAC